jgi:hypothetical protein
VWGAGEGGCFLCSPEDLLNKNVNYTQITTKSSLKMAFLWKTHGTKSLLRYFEAFFIFKKVILPAMQDLFPFLKTKYLLIHNQIGLQLKATKFLRNNYYN